MAAVTSQQLENAALDCQTLEDVVNGTAAESPVINRNGDELKTLAKIQAEMDVEADKAHEWATKTGTQVVDTGPSPVNDYSAKEYAIGDATASGGSAKAWATDTSSPNGSSDKSAKSYAADVAASLASVTNVLTTSALVTPFYQAISASAVFLRSGTMTLGNGVMTTANTFILNTPVANTGVITNVRTFATAGATLRIKVFNKSGNDFTQVGSDVVITTGANASNIPVAINVTAGQYIGFYGPSSMNFLSGGSDTFYQAAGNLSSLTAATATGNSTNFQIGFDYLYPAVTTARLTTDETNISTALALGNRAKTALDYTAKIVSLIRQMSFTMGGTGAFQNRTWVSATPTAAPGRLYQMRVFTTAAGTIKVKRMSRSGDTFTEMANQIVTVPASGMNTLTLDMVFEAGEYVGFYVDSNRIIITGNTDPSTGSTQFYSNGAVTDVTTFTQASPDTSTAAQIGFDFYSVAVTDARLTTDETNIATNAAGLTAANVKIDALNAQIVEVQNIGKQTAPTGGSGLASNTYIYSTPIKYTGYIPTVQWNGSGTNSINIKRFIRSGNTMTQVGSTVSVAANGTNGIQTATINMAVNAGEYVGITQTGNGQIRYLGATAPVTSFYVQTVADTTVPFTIGNLQTGYDIEVTLNAIGINVTKPEKKYVNLKNVDLIGLIGDSYTMGTFSAAPRGKNWLMKASAMSDWNFENFAESGKNYASQLASIQSGQIMYGQYSWKDYGVTHAIHMLSNNETNVIVDLHENMRRMIETTRMLGAVPIIATEHVQYQSTTGGEIVLKQQAEKLGAHFINVRETAASFFNATTANRNYYSTNTPHPGVRSNELLANPVIEFVASLGQPRQALKVYRKRSGFTVGTIQDLIHDTKFEQKRRFKEIYTGHFAADTTNEYLLDTVQNAAGGVSIASEYLQLRNNISIPFDDYGLIEVVMPAIAKNIDTFKLVLNDSTLTVYIRDVLTGAQTGAQGSWVQLTADSFGAYAVSQVQLKRSMRVDKATFLIYKSGGFGLTEASVEWTGKEGKPNFAPHPVQSHAKGAEMLTTTACTSLTGWTSVGTPTLVTTTADNTGDNFPEDATACILVDSTNKIKQTFNFPANTRDSIEVEVVVWARYWPTRYTGGSANYPANSIITQDSFDDQELQIDLIVGSGTVPTTRQVGLWWKRVKFRTFLPLGATSMQLQIGSASGSQPLQIALASVKPV